MMPNTSRTTSQNYKIELSTYI